jgi:hypothetical protein
VSLVCLTNDELHVLIQWGTAIEQLDDPERLTPIEIRLLSEAKAERERRLA